MTDKLFGEERRHFILQVLKRSSEPLTGTELAKKANVSRQVIVGDITLLKAKKEPIVATSQGYIYLKEQESTLHKRIVACYHTPDRTEEELNLIVDFGVTVRDVTIEHPVYGDLKASLMVSSRRDVNHFMDNINKNKASLLSQLTDGIHLHTLASSSEDRLDEAEQALRKADFLLDSIK